MKNINALKQRRADKSKALSALIAEHTASATAGEQPRGFTDAEKAAQKAIREEIAAADEIITAEEERIALERNHVANGGDSRIEATPTMTGGDLVAKKDPRRGFSSHRDFLKAAMTDSGLRDRSQVSDVRLRPLAVADKEDKNSGGELAFMLPRAFTPGSVLAAAGSDEQGEYDDRYGGISVPTTRLPGVLQVGFEGDPTAGRTQDIPMQTPSVSILSRVDKDHSTSVSGGFTVSRKPETVAASGTRAQMEEITLKAASLFGLSYATEELLTDSPLSFIAIIDTGYRTQFPAAILNEKINGLGGNEYLGVLTALATAAGNTGPTLSIAKESGQAAATINYQNTLKMITRAWGLNDMIWLANHTTRPQLAQLQIPTGVSAQLVYQPSPDAGLPDRLHGVPIFYTEFCKPLGTVGDLILANFSQFLEGTYQPIQSAESMHVRFANHERAFKFWTRNCGAPWWKSPLTPKNGDTLSPFVVLATRA